MKKKKGLPGLHWPSNLFFWVYHLFTTPTTTFMVQKFKNQNVDFFTFLEKMVIFPRKNGKENRYFWPTTGKNDISEILYRFGEFNEENDFWQNQKSFLGLKFHFQTLSLDAFDSWAIIFSSVVKSGDQIFATFLAKQGGSGKMASAEKSPKSLHRTKERSNRPKSCDVRSLWFWRMVLVCWS